MGSKPLPMLRAAVVGHTNTGKTSLMRTLLRDQSFGEVSDQPGTTRAVSAGALRVDGEPMIELYDTPGLEDPMGVLEALDAFHDASQRRTDGYTRLQRFLESDVARTKFAHEAMSIRQVLESDVALYVIDARDRVLGKHRDELEILAYTAKPVVPVLNFVASEAALTGTWREALARVNMHAVAEFDTVVVTGESELQLFEKMRTLLDAFRPTIDAVVRARRTEREQLLLGSAHVIAELLIDVAAFVSVVDLDEKDELPARLEAYKDRVRQREQRTVDELLELHRFRAEDCDPESLPIDDGQWGLDLFSPAALQKFGLRAGGAAGAGALIGLGLDAAVGGLSLGAGAALGAALGALAGAAKMTGKRLIDRLRGKNELRVNEATLQLLAARQMELVGALMHRGHASQSPIHLAAHFRSNEKGRAALREVLHLARRAVPYPEWSRLNTNGGSIYRGGPGREQLIQSLARAIARALAPTLD